MNPRSEFGFNPYVIAAGSTVGFSAIFLLSEWLLPLALPFLKKVDKKKQYQACSYVPSTLFILMIVPMSVYVLAFDDKIKGVSSGSTEMSTFLTAIAFGYFIFDTLIIMTHLDVEGPALLAHGILCSITYGLAIIFEVYHAYGPVFLLFESSTLFVNIRWFLIETGYKNSTLYMINGAMLVLVFGLVRLVYGVSSSVSFWIDTFAELDKIPRPVYAFYMVSNISLNSLNFFWFHKILRAAIKALKVGRD